MTYHQRYYKHMDCPFLILIITLLCISKSTSTQLHKYHTNPERDYYITANITSSTDYPRGFYLQPELSRHISSPTQSSLDYSMDIYAGLRHLSCLVRVVRKGISPMYMADPSKTANREDPDWLVEFKRKQKERKRILRHGSPDGKKKKEKDPTPGWLRMRKCRERDKGARVTPSEECVIEVTYVSSLTFLII